MAGDGKIRDAERALNGFRCTRNCTRNRFVERVYQVFGRGPLFDSKVSSNLNCNEDHFSWHVYSCK